MFSQSFKDINNLRNQDVARARLFTCCLIRRPRGEENLEKLNSSYQDVNPTITSWLHIHVVCVRQLTQWSEVVRSVRCWFQTSNQDRGENEDTNQATREPDDAGILSATHLYFPKGKWWFDDLLTILRLRSSVVLIRVASSLTKVTQDRIWCCFDETSWGSC